MKYTGNYNLKKPDGTDVVNIEDFNENADIIDTELKKLNDAIKDLDADGITLPDGKTIAEKFDEIETEVGNIEELDTDTKTNVIAAINEINQALNAHRQNTNQEIGQVASDLAAHKAENASLDSLGHVKHAVLTATLNTTWSGTSAPYTKTVSVSGILSTDTPIIDVVMSGTYSTDEARIEAWGYIYRAVTADNSITFYAMEKPTVSLPIQIRVVR